MSLKIILIDSKQSIVLCLEGQKYVIFTGVIVQDLDNLDVNFRNIVTSDPFAVLPSSPVSDSLLKFHSFLIFFLAAKKETNISQPRNLITWSHTNQRRTNKTCSYTCLRRWDRTSSIRQTLALLSSLLIILTGAFPAAMLDTGMLLTVVSFNFMVVS